MPRPRKPGAASAQRTVDDAEMKYVVVHLHRLLEPDARRHRAAQAGRRLGLSVAPHQQRPLQQQSGREAADVRGCREQIAFPPASQPIITCSTTQATISHSDVDPAIDAQVVVNAFARPKLSAKAPITALIAPLAPIIGVAPCGSTAHCAAAAA